MEPYISNRHLIPVSVESEAVTTLNIILVFLFGLWLSADIIKATISK